MVDSLEKARAEGWDAAVEAITRYVTPVVRRKLLRENPFRKEE